MTPREIELLRVMLREEVTDAVAPVKKAVEDLSKRTTALEEADKTIKAKVSGQHRAVTKELIPQLRSEAEAIRKGDMGAVADAYNKMVHVVADIGDTVARIEKNSNRSLVELPDGQGGKSVRPASMVAAEFSVRTENKQDSIGKVVLDAALDTTKAKDNSAAAKRRATVTLVVMVVQAVVVGIYQAYQFIAHTQ